MSVQEGVERDLAELPDDLQDTAAAQVARSLARHLDNPSTTMAVASVARELRTCLDELRIQAAGRLAALEAAENPRNAGIADLTKRIASRREVG